MNETRLAGCCVYIMLKEADEESQLLNRIGRNLFLHLEVVDQT